MQAVTLLLGQAGPPLQLLPQQRSRPPLGDASPCVTSLELLWIWVTRQILQLLADGPLSMCVFETALV